MEQLNRLLRRYGFEPESGALYLLAAGILGIVGLVSFTTFVATRGAHEPKTRKPGSLFSGQGTGIKEGSTQQRSGSSLDYVQPRPLTMGTAQPTTGAPQKKAWTKIISETIVPEDNPRSTKPFYKPKMKTGKGLAKQSGRASSGAALQPGTAKRTAIGKKNLKPISLGGTGNPRAGKAAEAARRMQALTQGQQDQAAQKTIRLSPTQQAQYEELGRAALESAAQEAGSTLSAVGMDAGAVNEIMEGIGPTEGERDLRPTATPCQITNTCDSGGGGSGTLGSGQR
jgi:hypothetical protein